jgi:hypothetical protein
VVTVAALAVEAPKNVTSSVKSEREVSLFINGGKS